MSNDTIHSLESDIQAAKRTVELGKSLDRLMLNRDFKEVVLEGYFKDEAVRLVHLKSHPAMLKAESQGSILRQMDSIGELHGYFLKIENDRMNAEKAVESIEETIAEILVEEAA